MKRVDFELYIFATLPMYRGLPTQLYSRIRIIVNIDRDIDKTFPFSKLEQEKICSVTTSDD